MNAKDIKDMMMKHVGFAEGEDQASTIIVEFFDDQYEEEFAAAKSLMSVLARIADTLVDPHNLPRHAPTSMLICFTEAADHIPGGTERSDPELELRFWKELKDVVENQSSRLVSHILGVFRPTFIQSSSSATMGTRVRA